MWPTSVKDSSFHGQLNDYKAFVRLKGRSLCVGNTAGVCFLQIELFPSPPTALSVTYVLVLLHLTESIYTRTFVLGQPESSCFEW